MHEEWRDGIEENREASKMTAGEPGVNATLDDAARSERRATMSDVTPWQMTRRGVVVTHMYMCTCVYVYVYVYACIYIYIYMYNEYIILLVYIYIYIYMYMYIHISSSIITNLGPRPPGRLCPGQPREAPGPRAQYTRSP